MSRTRVTAPESDFVGICSEPRCKVTPSYPQNACGAVFTKPALSKLPAGRDWGKAGSVNQGRDVMLLVTGGAGFIGSNVVAALNEAGRSDVVICDFLGHDAKWRNLAKRRLAD